MLMSAEAYRESLRRLQPAVFVDGERIGSIADAPQLAPAPESNAARQAVAFWYSGKQLQEYFRIRLGERPQSRRLEGNDSVRGSRVSGASRQSRSSSLRSAADG